MGRELLRAPELLGSVLRFLEACFTFSVTNVSPTAMTKSDAAPVMQFQHSLGVNRKLLEIIQTVISGA